MQEGGQAAGRAAGHDRFRGDCQPVVSEQSRESGLARCAPAEVQLALRVVRHGVADKRATVAIWEVGNVPVVQQGIGHRIGGEHLVRKRKLRRVVDGRAERRSRARAAIGERDAPAATLVEDDPLGRTDAASRSEIVGRWAAIDAACVPGKAAKGRVGECSCGADK
eukprot:scaffold24198_cov73-Phaeocystis_antarctica.AAC.2